MAGSGIMLNFERMAHPDFNALFRIFTNHFNMEPVSGQRELIGELIHFTFSPEPYPVFVLSGYAGTGKTSILGAYVNMLRELRIQSRLLAPTGRAAKVLSYRSGKRASTIHKMIYRAKSAAEIGSPLSLAPNLAKNTVFVVDEASMIGDHSLQADGSVSRNLLEDLLEFVFSGKDCKLIFLGDEGQLPPVGSPDSPAMDVKHLAFHFPRTGIRKFRLTEVMRQEENSAILENATVLRTLTAGQKPALFAGKDLRFIEGGELQDVLEKAYDHSGMDETIVITRSNKRANAYNNQIRSRLLWFEEELCGSDILMVVKNNYFWLADTPEIGFVANGELLRVKRVLKRETLYGFDFARLLVEFTDYDIGEKEVLVMLETLQMESPSLPRDRQKELFFAIEADYSYELNKKKRYELILKDPYFNALQVKYAYAVTCHKAQGGQWENVFIDQGFIPDDGLNSDYYRWLYTALTRASQQAYLVNFPNEFQVI